MIKSQNLKCFSIYLKIHVVTLQYIIIHLPVYHIPIYVFLLPWSLKIFGDKEQLQNKTEQNNVNKLILNKISSSNLNTKSSTHPSFCSVNFLAIRV